MNLEAMSKQTYVSPYDIALAVLQSIRFTRPYNAQSVNVVIKAREVQRSEVQGIRAIRN